MRYPGLGIEFLLRKTTIRILSRPSISRGWHFDIPCTVIWVSGQSVDLLSINFALTLGRVYNFALTFDEAATVYLFDSSIQ